MEAKFSVGDVVVLTSGSVTMSIDSIIKLNSTFQYGCAYSSNGDVKVIFLHEGALQKFEQSENFYVG